MKKIFYLLSIVCSSAFSSKLLASKFVTLSDGRQFPITSAIGDNRYGYLCGIVGNSISIKTKKYVRSIDDGCACYVGNNIGLEAEEIEIRCGNTVYNLDCLEPGYYIRVGEKLLHKKL